MDPAAPALPFWLPWTKFLPPVPRDDTSTRPRLVARLREVVLNARLTLVSAPAGYGKTTLLAAFAASQPDLPLAWLALDGGDNDAARFLTALIAAVRRLSPDGGDEAAQLLASLPYPASEACRVVAALIDDLLPTLPDPCVLVLDDLHAIAEPAAFLALDFLLDHLPPQLHLLVATRHHPPLHLDGLRAEGQLAEVRAAELRFTTEEAVAFLDDSVDPGLANEQLALIQRRTEGCAAGLSLVAGILAGPLPESDRSAWLDELARTDRDVFDFLADAMLSGQEPAAREFLLTTAILAELTPARCATLTGREDAAATLAAIARRNPFVIPVERASHTYRSHDRAREFLRRQLARERAGDLPALHRRAVVAEREAGRPDRAIDQALAAGAWADAASLIDQIGGEMLERRALDSLGGWIAAVPEAVQEAYPRLSYLRGVIAWESGRGQEAQPLLDRARAGFRARGDREGEGDALAALIKVFARAEAFPRAMTLFDRALELPQRPHNRVDLLLSRSFWALAVGNWAQSIRDLEEAIAVAETTRAPRTLLVLATNFYGNMVFLPGGLAAVDRFQALVETSDDGGPVLRACSAHLAAIAALWRGDWSAAVPIAERALALSDRFDMLLRVEFGTRILLAGCAAITEDAAAADRHCADLLAMLERPAFAPIRTWTGVLLQAVGRVRVLQGRHDEARAVAERIDAEAAAGDWPSTPGGRAILRGLMLQAEGNHQGAEGFFREAKALLRPYPDALWFGDPDLLLAGSRLALGHPNEAVALLAPLLAECDRADTPGRLLWNGPATAAPLLRLAVSRGLHAAFAARVLAQAGLPAS